MISSSSSEESQLVDSHETDNEGLIGLFNPSVVEENQNWIDFEALGIIS